MEVEYLDDDASILSDDLNDSIDDETQNTAGSSTKSSKRGRKQNRRIIDSWTDAQVTKLIAKVESHSCIWDASHEHYKNRTVRDSAWNDIVASFDNNISAKQLMVKWQNLRNQYRLALSNAKKTKSGQAAEQTPHWKYASQMAFVGGTEEKQTVVTQSNLNLSSRSQSSTSIIEDLTDDSQSLLSIPGNSSGAATRKRKITKYPDLISKDEEETLLSGVKSALKYLEAPSPVPDDVQKFGEYVVSELRKVSNGSQRRMIQRQMLQYMWQLMDDLPVNVISLFSCMFLFFSFKLIHIDLNIPYRSFRKRRFRY